MDERNQGRGSRWRDGLDTDSWYHRDYGARSLARNVPVNEDEPPKHLLGPDGKPISTPGAVKFGFQPSSRDLER